MPRLLALATALALALWASFRFADQPSMGGTVALVVLLRALAPILVLAVWGAVREAPRVATSN